MRLTDGAYDCLLPLLFALFCPCFALRARFRSCSEGMAATPRHAVRAIAHTLIVMEPRTIPMLLLRDLDICFVVLTLSPR